MINNNNLAAATAPSLGGPALFPLSTSHLHPYIKHHCILSRLGGKLSDLHEFSA